MNPERRYFVGENINVAKKAAKTPNQKAFEAVQDPEVEAELKKLGYNYVPTGKSTAVEIAEGLKELGLNGVLVDTVKSLVSGLGTLVKHGVKTSDFDSDIEKLYSLAQQARLMGLDDDASKAIQAATDLITKKHSQ